MKRVLDVGNCDPDHAAIKAFLQRHAEVEVDRARLPADTFELLEKRAYDLVLINRKLDEDYSDGIMIIQQMKDRDSTAGLPVMLVTNHEEHQQAALALGALRGFGKLEFESPEAIQRVQSVLA